MEHFRHKVSTGSSNSNTVTSCALVFTRYTRLSFTTSKAVETKFMFWTFLVKKLGFCQKMNVYKEIRIL